MSDRETLWNGYLQALRALRDAKAGKQSGFEKAYGLSYQRMVDEGYAPRLRKKYRG